MAWTSRRASRPRVLILIDTEVIGGPGKNLLQFLQNADGKIDYLLCNFSREQGPNDSEFCRKAEAQGIKPITLRERFRFDWRPIEQAIQVARREDVDLIQSHNYKSDAVALAVSRRLRIPWIAFAHGWTHENRKVLFYNWLDRRLLKRADVAVAVSPALHDELVQLRGTAPTTMVLNAIEKTGVPKVRGGAAVRQQLGLGTTDFLVGTVGRLSREKGHSVLISAFSDVAAACPHAHLVIVGDGPERESLEEQTHGHDLSGSVHFVGHQSGAGDYYDAMDLMVLPSFSEGLPNAVLEAFITGTPVVATRVGGVEEIIRDGYNGTLVNAGEDKALAQAILALMKDEIRRNNYRKQGIRSLYPKFSPQKRAETILSIYRRVLFQTPAVVERLP